MLRLLLPTFLLLAALPARAQVQDTFADGDFTANPPWTGDTERFTVVPFGADFALRSDGLAEADTIALATASDVAFGRWTFTFRHEANLSTANGTRVYLVADTPDLTGNVQGYYVQIGTNNTDEVRLYRQDGAPNDRVVLGASDGALVPGDANTIFVEVVRDAGGAWTVAVDGAPVITGVTDATYTTSDALGVWLKHSSATGQAFFWDDVLADPDAVVDLTPPAPTGVTVQENGAVLLVAFDEPLDPASVAPGAFSLSGVGSPTSASLLGDGRTARLAFAPPIPTGDYTLAITGVADLAGNPVPPGTEIAFSFEADAEPPVLAGAVAVNATTVEVTFSEPVLGCDASLYAITPEVGTPGEIDCSEPTGAVYRLLLDQPLAGPQLYTVTASGVSDTAGNVQPETSATFFFGDFGTPAPRDIVLNEILYDPPEVASNEYVELYNRTADATFDLSQFALADATSEPTPIAETSVSLGPGEYVVLVRNPDAFEARFPGVPYLAVDDFPALNNTGDTPTLLHDGTVIDAVPYAASWGGMDAALERKDPHGPSAFAGNWATSTDPRGGTPGAPNSVFEPDTTPPVPTDADVSADGQQVFVTFDEPLDPASVTPGAFTLSGAAPAVTAAEYSEDLNPQVTLTLAAPLAPGTYTVTVTGITDLTGNATDGAEVEVIYAPDQTPPEVLQAFALDATTVEVRFDEVVDAATATVPGNYTISDGIGQPVSVIYAPEGDGARVRLTLGTPLEGPQQYLLTVTGVADLAGNALDEQAVMFFFGEGAVPEPGDLVVNEILYDPPEVNSNEFVEVLNASEAVFDLADFTLSDLSSTTAVTDASYLLGPGEYAVLVRDPDAFEARFPGVPYVAVDGFPALNNTGDAVVLRYAPDDGPAVTVDSVRFQPAWGGTDASLERRSPEGPSHVASNWTTTTDPRGGTPGAPNTAPPDTEPPLPTEAVLSPDARTVTVYFDEPLDPTTVTPGAFTISGGVGQPETVVYDPNGPLVQLSLSAPPPEPGLYTVSVSGVADLLGNVTTDAEVAFEYDPDVQPPRLVEAEARSETEVLVRFSEALDAASATDPAHYQISDGIGQPAAVIFAPEGAPSEVLLTLASPLQAQRLYTLTVTGIADAAGNVLEQGQIAFFFGEGAVPEPGDLVINEILYDPPDTATNEWVELYNPTDQAFDLRAFVLADESAAVPVTTAPRFLLPGGYAVLVRNAGAFEAAFPEVPFVAVSGFPGLGNQGDAVVLRYAPENGPAMTVDSVRYRPNWGGTDASLERRDPRGPSNSAGNWGTTLASVGTPGSANTLPPDTTPPAPEEVEVDHSGTVVTVLFSERLDPASVVPGAFAIEGAGTPAEATYFPDPDPVVDLTLGAPLEPGSYTLTVAGVRDLQGNVQESTQITFTFDPDRAPPALLGADALDPTTVEVLFSEALDPETAGDPARYTLSDGIGQPEAVVVAPGGDPERVRLTLATELQEDHVYTLTVSGIADRFGNVLEEATTRLLLGEAAVPAPGDLVVNEIMYRLPSARNAEEYVELYNRSDATFDLSRLTLADVSGETPAAAAPLLLLPGEYVALVADADAFRARFGAFLDLSAIRFIEVPRFPSLNNSADAVVLRHEGAVIDSVYYDDAWQRPELDDPTGIALERLDPDGPSNAPDNWTSALAQDANGTLIGGTPGLPNSVLLPPGAAPTTAGVAVEPSPFDAREGTRIQYTLAAEAALVRARIFDAAGRLVRTLEEATLGGGAVTGAIPWNGLDDAGQPLRVGIYVVFLEALDLAGGQTEAYKAVVVLGRQL